MKYALISVFDKTNVLEFSKELVENDFKIISTGGTYKYLTDNGIDAIKVEDITKFPEILDGRVKTLHPLLYGGILSIRHNKNHVQQVEEHNINFIDLVAIDLYPFLKTVKNKNNSHEDIIENIDIGGVSLIRAAAKNYKDVITICDINDYQLVIDTIKNKKDDKDLKVFLAQKAFAHTSSYDSLIANYMLTKTNQEEMPKKITMSFTKKEELRYGENPHQKASWYVDEYHNEISLSNAEQLHGKQLSYNNLLDANSAINIVKDLNENSCMVGIKHLNPCGVAINGTVEQLWEKVLDSDSVSIFGGIVATNQVITKKVAEELSKVFLEIIIAQDFEKEALDILLKKKNLRLLKLNYKMSDLALDEYQYTSIDQGLLVQQKDLYKHDISNWKCVTNNQLSEEELKEAQFAYTVVKHVKSNAIALTKNFQTIGVGPGQMNRVGSAKIALEQAEKKAEGSFLASDAFLPFNDVVELASQYKVKAIIQPGGSLKDQESIDLANEKGIAMIFTNIRHFKH
ncbi:bifunctional phosphoribosylaminoimidazolecarboxamide formyltransferase/IMP cyclohydrolase [Spiroplasma tabanidicola]|uniref:Bifunctional purine biosynthesis protein PurH n=1 Tax=Spiroplasma tabanidicola TaxID=324079 RepID=A0A6I6CBE3_9MOLU|nr:bifunctional phosphoribosylaminoimidazolecarboxamide formyltransferase/IMP cyclohydrolase [Spiroplasma tabanidicola]QGS52261.1 phosphoribosylaminoimidazolecarboxamide formyltransferase / IMP cyclohydrolase [Spiroplasma tabanidicola]